MAYTVTITEGKNVRLQYQLYSYEYTVSSGGSCAQLIGSQEDLYPTVNGRRDKSNSVEEKKKGKPGRKPKAQTSKAIAVETAPATEGTTKRRGRKPGSKNKAKVETVTTTSETDTLANNALVSASSSDGFVENDSATEY